MQLGSVTEFAGRTRARPCSPFPHGEADHGQDEGAKHIRARGWREISLNLEVEGHDQREKHGPKDHPGAPFGPTTELLPDAQRLSLFPLGIRTGVLQSQYQPHESHFIVVGSPGIGA
jgi:hypothetical protein